MKNLFKQSIGTLLSVILLSSFILAPNGGNDKGEKISFYHTLDDYKNGKTSSSWDNYIMHDRYSFDATIDGKKVKNGSFGDVDDWGFVDSKGVQWRSLGKMGALEIICTGKIWLYGDGNILQFKGQNESTVITNHRLDRDEYGIYMSMGGNGNIEICDNKTFKKYIADDPDVAQKLKDYGGLHEYKYKLWDEDLKKMISWINEYNSKHK